jgi:hypothetical protein
MKLSAPLSALSAFAVTTLIPALALACPGSGGMGAGSACGSCGGSGYGTALSVGLLAGLGSVVLESVLRRRRE